MSELPSHEHSIPAAGTPAGRRRVAADQARSVQTFALTSVPAAAPMADMVKARLSGEISAQVADLVELGADLARQGAYLTAEGRHAFDRERKRRVWAKGLPAESQHPSPPLNPRGRLLSCCKANRIQSPNSRSQQLEGGREAVAFAGKRAEPFILLETGGDRDGTHEEYASFAALAVFTPTRGCDRLNRQRPIDWKRP
jgi:hypothetical protein